jgi:hypothetical protein
MRLSSEAARQLSVGDTIFKPIPRMRRGCPVQRVYQLQGVILHRMPHADQCSLQVWQPSKHKTSRVCGENSRMTTESSQGLYSGTVRLRMSYSVRVYSDNILHLQPLIKLLEAKLLIKDFSAYLRDVTPPQERSVTGQKCLYMT